MKKNNFKYNNNNIERLVTERLDEIDYNNTMQKEQDKMMAKFLKSGMNIDDFLMMMYEKHCNNK